MIDPTVEQEEFASRPGVFSARACPGSGKTVAVAARLAEKLRSWSSNHQGIAALSFTNVAKDEMESVLGREFGVATPLQYPHFIGTIDSFVDRFIFLPFGHLVMSCAQRPTLVGPPHDDWEPIGHGWFWRNVECNKKGCRLNDFTYGLDSRLLCLAPVSHFGGCLSGHRTCEALKLAFCRAGYATQTDANYFAMAVLDRYPTVRNALAIRFPCVLLDEAQDTSDIQMRIMELLVNGGCGDMALVGDPDQSIYEWRRATPEVFAVKCRECEADTRSLTENWRSSQRICDFFTRISSLERPPKAVNPEYSGYAFDPEIWDVAAGDCRSTVDRFLTLCSAHGIANPADIAVLCRGRELLSSIQGSASTTIPPDPWKDRFSRNVAFAKFLFQQGQPAAGFHLIERTVYEFAGGSEESGKRESMRETIRGYGVVKWRREISALLADLPSTTYANLKDWTAAANGVLPSRVEGLSLAIKRDRAPNAYSALSFADVFRLRQQTLTDRYVLGTVHSVKGETFQAVLFIAKHKAASGQTYETILSSNIADNEELRTVYVAITRPRRLLVLAVPHADLAVWKARFAVN